MEENAELQAKIAALAGRINRHKTVAVVAPQAPAYSGHYTPDYGRGSHAWTPQRGTPYGAPRGRGWSRGTAHRNRTLVVNGPGHVVSGEPSSVAVTSGESVAPGNNQAGWVSKRDRHMQLINTAVYEQKSQERSKAMAETRKQKAMASELREMTKLNTHLRSLAIAQQPSHYPVNKTQPAHQVIINDIKFVVTEDGSKLIKAPGGEGLHGYQVSYTDASHVDPINMAKTTPKRADLGDVIFLRSKHGNLYRAGFVKTKRSGMQISSTLGKIANRHMITHRLTDVKKIAQPCVQFSTTGNVLMFHGSVSFGYTYQPNTRSTTKGKYTNFVTGTCSKGPDCRYEHDPNKVAICRDFLQTGKCQAGLNCDLSHDPTPERVPACLHFIRGNCTNPDCRYAHVRTNPGAPVCRTFAVLGFCPKGATCQDRHVYECPDFANKGICRNKKCRLQHVHRAGQLRKVAAIQKDESDGAASSDISSDDELAAYDSDDVDSDDFDEDFSMPDASNHELSQQVDFVKFS